MLKKWSFNQAVLLGIVVVAMVAFPSVCNALTLYASPTGTPGGDGSFGNPMDIDTAFARTDATEIQLLDGTYPGLNYSWGQSHTIPDSSYGALTVRAAEGANPILSAGERVTTDNPAPGLSGVYLTTIRPLDPVTSPQMWERGTRVRYSIMITKNSVVATPASVYYDRAEGMLYFHTSDGQAPTLHEVYSAHCANNMGGIKTFRTNVTITGITFKDLAGMFAVASAAAGTVVTNCKFDNCGIGVQVTAPPSSATIEDCTGTDVGTGVFSNGTNVVARWCSFVKVRDRFLPHTDAQSDGAYEVYFNGVAATFEYNFAKGYRNGILVKTQPGTYTIRHNTLVDVKQGIDVQTDLTNDDVQYNIVTTTAGAYAPLFMATVWWSGLTLDNNVYWDINKTAQQGADAFFLDGQYRGANNVFADPKFIDPANGDYRLLPTGSQVPLDNGVPAGRFGFATVVEEGTAPACLRKLDLSSTGYASYRPGHSSYDVGTQSPTLNFWADDLARITAVPNLPKRVVTSTTLTVGLGAWASTGSLTSTRITVDGGGATTQAYDASSTITLPAVDGDHTVQYEVQGTNGVWSAPLRAVINLDSVTPAFVGTPTSLVNDSGIIVMFTTNKPCKQAQVLCVGTGSNVVYTPPSPKTTFAVGLVLPQVRYHQNESLLITIVDEADRTAMTSYTTPKIKGAVRTAYVSPMGVDAAGRGSLDQPYKTLQYAADRSLPGDTVNMKDGTYTDPAVLNHGGLSGKRLTIKCDSQNLATIDGGMQCARLIDLQSSSYVTISNLRLLRSTQALIYANNSPYLSVDHVTGYQGLGWLATGNGIMCDNASNYPDLRFNLLVGGGYGFWFNGSTNATVLNNTCSQGNFAAAWYNACATNVTQKNNSFSYAGNDIYYILGSMSNFVSDYNNLGTVVAYGDPVQYGDQAVPYMAYPSQFRTDSKSVVAQGPDYYGVVRYRFMADWRTFSGQDTHSIFADPRYVLPYAYDNVDNWDWRILTGSPNIGAGEGGVNIGATAVQP